MLKLHHDASADSEDFTPLELHNPEDEGTTLLRNVSNYVLPVDTA
jgi:hypothetical protein